VLEQTLLADTEIAFAEGKPARKAGEILLELFKGLGKLVPFGEHAPGGAADPDAALRAEFAAHRATHAQLGVTFEMFKQARTSTQ
jgi:hypothetical protein